MHFVAYMETKNSCIYCAEYCIKRVTIYEYGNSYSINCCRYCEKNKLDEIKFLLFQIKSEKEYKNEIQYWKRETSFYKKEYERYKQEYEILTRPKPKKRDLFS
jgi:hypothetical protein